MVAFSVPRLVSLASFLAALPPVSAGFLARSNSNNAVYWGQNSVGKADSQKPLASYCNNPAINIIYISFLTGMNPPMTNFASATDLCTPIKSSPGLHYCQQIENDIKTCQDAGITIILSMGGATYSQGGWSSPGDAQASAHLIWSMFGPPTTNTTINRPFGQSTVDGFDFDFEAPTNNLDVFGTELRKLMDADSGKKYYLSAAPQCVFPDAAIGALLNAVPFDFVGIQFYNNWCGVVNFKPGAAVQNAFNFDVWHNWAMTSKNPDVKLLAGTPAAPGAGGGYVNASLFNAVLEYSRNFSSFGGIMLWDMSQLYSNPDFLHAVLGRGNATTVGNTTTAGNATTVGNTTTGVNPTTTTTIRIANRWRG